MVGPNSNSEIRIRTGKALRSELVLEVGFELAWRADSFAPNGWVGFEWNQLRASTQILTEIYQNVRIAHQLYVHRKIYKK